MRRLIVDANVIVSSLLRKGIPFRVFVLNSLLNKFDFFAPELLIEETKRHEEELLEETKLPKDIFFDVMNFLFEEIDIVPKAEFEEFIPKAKELLPEHRKDVPYLALALKLDCPIFSGDKVLRTLLDSREHPVKVISPRELLNSFFEPSSQVS